MKQSKWKEILTSNQMFIVYIIVVLCIADYMKSTSVCRGFDNYYTCQSTSGNTVFCYL